MTGSVHDLADRAAVAGQWRLAGSALTTALQFAASVVLARLLTPADFGVMALALVVQGLVQRVGDLGMGAAIVNRVHLTDRHIRTAFTVAVLLGAGWSALAAVAAPAVATLMHEPRLAPVLLGLAPAFTFAGASVVGVALLRRRLDFRRQFVIDAISYLLGYGLVAITLAALGFGVWSLVWGTLVQAVTAAIALIVSARHVVRPLLATTELAELLRFGAGTALSGGVNYAALNGDNVVVGRLLGSFDLGLYSRAYALMNVPFTYVTGVMSSVLFPAFSQIQSEPERLRRAYLSATRLASVLAASPMVMLAVGAPYVVPLVYGAQWTGVVFPLQILCVAGYFRALYHLGGVVAQSVGRVYGELWNQIGYAVLVIAGAGAGSRFGLAGVAIGISVAILYMFVATGRLALRATGADWTRYAAAQGIGLATAGLAGAAALAMRALLEAVQARTAVIALGVLAGAAVPWAVGTLWTLGEPAFRPVRDRLPRRVRAMAEGLRERH